MPADSDLHVVVVNWNAVDDTLRCVRALQLWSQLRPAIWVVDNASHDGSADLLQQACPEICLIRNERNLGFAGGNNVALAQIIAHSDAPILLLNNDAAIEEGSVRRLQETLSAGERVSLVGPLLFEAGRPGRLLSAGGKDIALHPNSHLQQLHSGPALREVCYVPGTVLLVRAALFHAIGLLDERYFFSGEIADLCARARSAGQTCLIDTRARAHHDLARSTPLRETVHVYYSIRNRFLYAHKFHPRSRRALDAFWLSYGLSMSIKARLSGKRAKARAARLAVTDGLRGRFGAQNERLLQYTRSGSSS